MMLIYGLILLLVLINCLNTLLNKNFQSGFEMDFSHFLMYFFLNSAFACIYFYLTSGFHIFINSITIIFSVIYASVVCLALTIGLAVLSIQSVGYVSILSNSGSLIITALFGYFYLNEKMSTTLILSIVLMLGAVSVTSVGEKGKKLTVSGVILLILHFLNSGMTNIVSKLYTLTPGVSNSASFFFTVNLILLIVSAIFITGHSLIRKKKIKMLFTKGQVINIASRTALSNISSVLSIIVISKMNVSVYTMTTTSMSLISSTLLSRFYFRENITAKNWISLFLAVFAVILNSF